MSKPPPLPPKRRADPAPPRGRRPLRRRRRWLVPVIVLGSLILLGCLLAVAHHVSQERRFQRALAMVERGEHKRAQPYLRSRLESDPDDVEARYALGRTYGAERDWGKAIDCYEGVLERDGEHVGAHIGLGRAHLAQDQPEQAAEHLELATQRAPERGDAWYHLGMLRHAQQRPMEAETAFRHAADGDGPTARAKAMLGRVLHEQGRTHEGLAMLDAALADHPTTIAVHFQLGEVHRLRGAYDIAVDRYRAARELGLDSLACDMGLAEALFEIGESNEAIRAMEEATQKHEREPRPWYLLGRAREKLNDIDGAMACYQRCLALDGDHHEAADRLNNLRRTTGK